MISVAAFLISVGCGSPESLAVGSRLLGAQGRPAATTCGSPERTTRFSVVAKDGVSWLQGRDGKPFFSMGVCCVEPGTSFNDYDQKNPSYAAYKYYPDGKE